MNKRVKQVSAPFKPPESLFNEKQRSSYDRNRFQFGGKEETEARLSFGENHYNQFQVEDRGGVREVSPKRKRQNPLGDFKLVKINEIF